MSGFFGSWSRGGFPADQESFEEQIRVLRRRGPDGESHRTVGDVFFSQAEFTVAEAPRKRPPPPLSLDGSSWIVGDIRLDARRDLIRRLAGRGVDVAKDATDVELVLLGWHEWGERVVDYIAGDFAFAIYEKAHRRIVCARDQIGTAQLFYTLIGRSFVFSNSLACLVLLRGFDKELDRLAVADFLMFGHPQDMAATIYRGARRLPPGHWCAVTTEGISTRRYWSVTPTEPRLYKQDREYIEEFRDILGQAVSDRLGAGRIGVRLSGGMDSSSVAALAAQIVGRDAARERLAAFVYRGITNKTRVDSLSGGGIGGHKEEDYARRTAIHLNIPVRVESEDGYELFRYPAWSYGAYPEPTDYPYPSDAHRLTWDLDDPPRTVLTGFSGDSILLPTPGYLSRCIRARQYKLALWVLKHSLLVERRMPPVGLRTKLRGLFGTPPIGQVFPPWFEQQTIEELRLVERWTRFQPGAGFPSDFEDAPQESMLFELRSAWWPYCFSGFDPNTSGLPQVYRHPFMDLRVIEFCMSLPQIPWFQDKSVLRYALHHLLPAEVSGRAKSTSSGSIVIRKLMRLGEDHSFMYMRGLSPLTGMVNGDILTMLVRNCHRLTASEESLITYPLSLLAWCHRST